MSESAKSIVLLELIKEQKDILFEESTEITSDVKKEKWEQLANSAKEKGVLAMDKDGDYVRSVLWQNKRRRTARRQSANKKSDKIDELVLEIIGIY